MATSEFIDRLIHTIAYEFKNPSLLGKALTAPGAEGDKEGTGEEQEKYAGNRSLAQVGRSLLQVVVESGALSQEEFKQSDMRKLLEPATAGQNHIDRAKALQIDLNTKLSPRQRNVAEPRTIQLTIYAIVGAVWWDCGKNFAIIEDVIERLFLGAETRDCIDPQDIPFDELIFMNLLDDCNLEGSQLAQDTSTLYSAVNTDLILKGHCASRELNPNNVHSVPTSHTTQESTANITDEQDQEQHSPIFFDSETLVFSPLEDVLVADHDQITDLAFHFDRHSSTKTFAGREITSRQDEESGNDNHVQQTQGQNSVKFGPVTRKRKLIAMDSETRQTIDLHNYFILEEKRCQSVGQPFPWTNVDSTILASNKSLKNGDLATLKTLFFVLGSPESLVALQEIVKAQRITNADEELGGELELSPVERLKVINSIGPGIASLVLRRRCHIYQLFLDCSKNSRKTSDGFVNDTALSISRQGASRIGNPNNLEDSQIVDDMLNDVYPDLQPDSDTYQKKRRYVGNLRKLGKRFDILVKNFGYGILGLLSWPRDDQLEVPALAITDEQLLSLSDAVFKSFIVYLTKVQGEHLCAISSAVFAVVTALFRGPLPTTSFTLEEAEASEILGFPKGSLALLRLIA